MDAKRLKNIAAMALLLFVLVLLFSSGASNFPSVMNYEVVHNFYPVRKSRHFSD
jgi:hypothetical protein